MSSIDTNGREISSTLHQELEDAIRHTRPPVNWTNWIGVLIGIVGLSTGLISTTITTLQKMAVLEQRVQDLTITVNELRTDIKELNKELNKRDAK